MADSTDVFDGTLNRFEALVLDLLDELDGPDRDDEPDIREVPIEEMVRRCDEASVWSEGFAQTAPFNAKALEVYGLLSDMHRREAERFCKLVDEQLGVKLAVGDEEY